MHYLIIGAGAAALSAAATLRQADPTGRVTLLSNDGSAPYARMALPYLLSGKITEQAFFLAPPPGVTLLPDERVTRLLPDRHEVETESGKRFFYDRLLVASGGAPEKPAMPGGNLPFVFTVRHLPDIVGIKSRLGGATGRAVIAGAGPVGMETADALWELGMSVTLVVASKRIFSTVVDAPAADWLAAKLRERGVEIMTGEEIALIRQDGTVELKSGKSLSCDLVIFGKGVEPDTPFLACSGMEVGRGILVDERQETNIPGIYAAGDAAQGRDLLSGKSRVDALWPVAVEHGRIAALNMAGVPALYPGSLSRNILRVFGISIFAAGSARNDDGYEVLRAEGADFHRKIVLERGVLKGMIFLGEVRHEGLYCNLLEKRADVSAFADSLLRGGYPFARHLARACREPA